MCEHVQVCVGMNLCMCIHVRMCMCLCVQGQVPDVAIAFGSWLNKEKEEDRKLNISQFGVQGTPPGMSVLGLCDLGIVQGLVTEKVSDHGSRLCCHHLKVLKGFEMRPLFYSVLGL